MLEFLKNFAQVYLLMGGLTFLCVLCRTRQLTPSLMLGVFWPYILLESD